MDEIINNLDNLTELDFCSIYIKMDELLFLCSVCAIKFVDFVCKRNIYNNLQKRITLMELAN